MTENPNIIENLTTNNTSANLNCFYFYLKKILIWFLNYFIPSFLTKHQCVWGIMTLSTTPLVAPPPAMSPMWPGDRVRLWVHLFPGVRLLHRTRRPRLERRERCSVSAAMAYEQKLAEKLTILNERGNGVLIRMNYIKKVREKRKTNLVCVWQRIRNFTFDSDALYNLF